MGGVGDDRAEIGRMQAALQAWVHQMASGSARLRGIRPPVLLSLLCAAACSPLLAAVTGVDAAVVAGSAVLSSVGGGVLSGIIVEALDRARAKGKSHAPTSAVLEEELAGEIGRVLAAGDENAQSLRAEIATVLQRIDAGGTVLQAAVAEGNERIISEVIDAIGDLGSDFAEMRFLIAGVARAAVEIQQSLDARGADIRVIIDQNNQQAADIRLVRDAIAVIVRRIDAGPLTLTRTTGRATAASFTVTPGTYQCFHVEAFNSFGDSGWSNYACMGVPWLVLPGKGQWTNTGVNLAAGDEVFIKADGFVYINRTIPEGPAGNPACIPLADYPAVSWSFPAPTLPCWSLVARVGNGPPFEVGTSTVVITASGRLYLGVNERAHSSNSGKSGNSGSWDVNIKIGGIPP